MRRPHHEAGFLTVNELARLLGMEGRLVSALLHPVAPAGWTSLGRPAWALEAALPALRPTLARQLGVVRCRLAAPLAVQGTS